VRALALTQLISWGTLYYAFPVVLAQVGRHRGWSQTQMIGAFSTSLLVSGLSAYAAGRCIQLFGGRRVMTLGSILSSLALLLAALAPTLPFFYLAWILAGIAMALTLYEPAFAVLSFLYSDGYRKAVTAVTLAGGLASSVFWPLTERIAAGFGWQSALFVFSGVHMMICAPLHWIALPDPGTRTMPVQIAAGNATALRALARKPAFVFLTASFTLNAVVFSIIAIHLIPLLESRGATTREAVWMAALAGPMQVAGRVMDLLFAGHRKVTATGLASLIALAAALFGMSWPGSSQAMMLLCIGLYGMANGVMTIVRGVIVVEMFGREYSATISGTLSVPGTLARAAGPWLASLWMGHSLDYSLMAPLLAGAALLSAALYWKAASPKPGE